MNSGRLAERSQILRHFSRMQKSRLHSLTQSNSRARFSAEIKPAKLPTPKAAIRTIQQLQSQNRRLQAELLVSSSGSALVQLRIENDHLLQSVSQLQSQNDQLRSQLFQLCDQRNQDGILSEYLQTRAKLQSVNERTNRLHRQYRQSLRINSTLVTAVHHVREEIATLQAKDPSKESVAATIADLRAEVRKLRATNQHLKALNSDFQRQILERAKAMRDLQAKVIEQSLVLQVLRKRVQRQPQQGLQSAHYSSSGRSEQPVSLNEAQTIAKKAIFNLMSHRVEFDLAKAALENGLREDHLLQKGRLLSILRADPFGLEDQDSRTLLRFVLENLDVQRPDQANDRAEIVLLSLFQRYKLLTNQEQQAMMQKMRSVVRLWLRSPDLPARVTPRQLSKDGKSFGYDPPQQLVQFIERLSYSISGQFQRLNLVELARMETPRQSSSGEGK